MELRPILFHGHELAHPIINAAGTCKTLEDVEKFARTDLPVITVGSANEPGSGGNPGNVFEILEHSAINSIGLTNPGRAYYEKYLAKMVELAHNNGKLLTFNVSCNSPEEFHRMVLMALNCGVDYAEINTACPNKWDGGKQGQIFGFDMAAICAILDLFTEEELKRIGVKPPPYSDPTLRVRFVEEVLLGYFMLAYVASANTFPNCFAFQENWRPAIDSAKVPAGYGGGSGPGFKTAYLGQVKQIREKMDEHEELRDMPIIGIGGVWNGRDVLEHIKCGATLVGLASAYMEHEDMGVFGRILTEYVDEVSKEK